MVLSIERPSSPILTVSPATTDLNKHAMQTSLPFKTGLAAFILLLSMQPADARLRHRHSHPTIRVTVAPPRPVPPVRIVRLSTLRERLARAQAYLSSHKTISAKRYARLTGLTRSAARAELDTFARDSSTRIAAVGAGKRKCYTLIR